MSKNLRERGPAAWLLIRRIPRAQAPKGEAAFVYGAGADFKLSRQIFVRAEYRGLVYDSPTFGLPGLSGLSRLTHRAKPSIAFGFSF